MDLQLTSEEVEELRGLLDTTISDLSPEIADTDNPAYRMMLRHRRDLFTDIRARLPQHATIT